MSTAKMTSKGQLTIPKDIRQRLGIHTGDRVEFVILEDVVTIVPANKDITQIKGLIPKPSTPVSVEEMNEAISQMGQER